MVEKKYQVFGEISQRVKGEKPILVGGSAVEFYTQGAYKSLDLDILGKKKDIEPIMNEMGFKKSGRHWYTEDLSLEIVGSSTKERIKTMKIGDSEFKVISVEDLIVDRLNACRHWNSELDCEQASYLLAGYNDQMDMKYLQTRAKEEKVSEELKKLKKNPEK
jgi:predicted nucleotidyltransferase